MKKTARHLLGVVHLVANHINPPSSYWGKNVFKKKKRSQIILFYIKTVSTIYVAVTKLCISFNFHRIAMK